MRAISRRKQSWFRHLLQGLVQKTVSLLIKFGRCTPNLRPRSYSTWRQKECPTDNGVTKNDDSVRQEFNHIVQDLIYSGFAGLALFGEADKEKALPTHNKIEELHFYGVDFYDVQTLQKQGNFELALMAGGQVEVDSDEDENFAEYDDCGECVRFEEWEEDR
ncbi:uncharacterized protein Dana_GF11000 [Drosophila ananassae]|uniref:Uncharacterized protein n=1 Tax=Drosophila ananassae TaxID=7217 RepID=B3MB91_DROAN|nr:uncharacterized protein LOC6493866 [Drosophila ananassae]EDV41392.1 uncharacterized protein Dana_GF11000 [Drosophila ananassae]